MRHIILKEIREYLYNPRAAMTVVATAALIFIALYNGYAAYRTFEDSARTGNAISREIASGAENYEELGTEGITVAKQPDRLMIFDIGISGVIGARADVRVFNRPQPRDSRYGSDPVLATFGELDVTFVVGMILSLFALLYSYGLISGERESGTLRLIAANSVKRSSIIIGKIAGAFTSLALSFIVPLLLGVIVLLAVTDIRFSGDEWARIGLMVFFSLLYLFVFFAIGAAVSALTRTSSISFLICLIIWICSVTLIPRLAVHAAELFSPSYSIDEVSGKVSEFRRNLILETGKYMKEYFDEHTVSTLAMATEMGNAMRYVQKQMTVARLAFEDGLYADINAKRDALLRTAENVSLASPTCAFTFAMHAIANSGPQMMRHYDEDLLNYRQMFKNFIEAQPVPKVNIMDAVKRLGVEFDFSNQAQVKLKAVRRTPPPPLDLKDLPRFEASPVRMDMVISRILINGAALMFLAILFFAIAYVAFIRYDVR